MIALDTSSLIAYFAGERGTDVEAVGEALHAKQAALPPVVLAELFSASSLPDVLAKALQEIPLLDPLEDYWLRCGLLRAKIRAKGLKARLADALIAQSCLDHGAPLVTRDRDFRHFERHGGLRLIAPKAGR